MAVARDAISSQVLTATTASVSHTCAASAFLVVGTRGSTVHASSVTYNGVNLTKVADVLSGVGEYNMTLWYLSNPASGANTLTATVSGGSVGFWASSYTGVLGWIDASTNKMLGSGTAFTTSVTTATDNDWAVGHFSSSANTLTAGTGTNFLFTQLNNTCLGDSNGVITPAGTYSMSTSAASGSFSSCIMTLSPTAIASTIQQDNNTFAPTVTATTNTFNHTIRSNTNGIVLVYAHKNSGVSDTFTGVTYNGVSMTRINSVASANSDMFDAVYYLLAPPTGTNSVVVTSSASIEQSAFAASYTGVSQVAPAVTNSGSSGISTTTFTLSLTTNTTNCWIYATEAQNAVQPLAGTGVTHLLSSERATPYRQQADSGNIATASSYSMTWNYASNLSMVTMTQLAPAVSVIRSSNLLLMGVG